MKLVLIIFLVWLPILIFADLYEAVEDGKFDEKIMERQLAERRAADD